MKIAIVGGSRKKAKDTTTAGEMFKSGFFRLAKDYAVFAFKAENVRTIDPVHGVRKLNDMIRPFDKTMKMLSNEEKDTWAKSVVEQLKLLPSGTEIVFLCGTDYVKPVRKQLEESGYIINHFTHSLGGMGHQLKFFKENGPPPPPPKTEEPEKSRVSGGTWRRA